MNSKIVHNLRDLYQKQLKNEEHHNKYNLKVNNFHSITMSTFESKLYFRANVRIPKGEERGICKESGYKNECKPPFYVTAFVR